MTQSNVCVNQQAWIKTIPSWVLYIQHTQRTRGYLNPGPAEAQSSRRGRSSLSPKLPVPGASTMCLGVPLQNGAGHWTGWDPNLVKKRDSKSHGFPNHMLNWTAHENTVTEKHGASVPQAALSVGGILPAQHQSGIQTRQNHLEEHALVSVQKFKALPTNL